MPTWYNGTAQYYTILATPNYTISATPNGTVTAQTISGTSATVSTGTNTGTVTVTLDGTLIGDPYIRREYAAYATTGIYHKDSPTQQEPKEREYEDVDSEELDRFLKGFAIKKEEGQ